MFKIAKPDTTYTHPVTVNVPIGEGKTDPQNFTAEFLLIDTDELNKTLHDDTLLFARVLVGWEGIVDHKGTPLKFSASARDRVSKISCLAAAIGNAYREFALGLPSKNFRPPLDS